MNQIQLTNITLILGGERLFDNLNWEIQSGQKIGLIGLNGAGKSSLFKLILGEYNPEPGGFVTRTRLLTTGYLPQQPELDPTQTAFEAALDANPQVVDTHNKLEMVETSLGNPDIYTDEHKLQKALEQHNRLIEEYHNLGGDNYPVQVRNILLGLGLPEGDLSKPLAVLSGGQKKLVGLARLLLIRPDILFLDEPDNHLDLAGKIYLEKLIHEYEGTVVIISHDRYLLDAAVTQIAELEDGKLKIFKGDYSSYLTEKEAQLVRQDQLFRAQSHEIEPSNAIRSGGKFMITKILRVKQNRCKRGWTRWTRSRNPYWNAVEWI
jgi:ATP-binding cassette subfamily F protein 3